MKVYDVLDLTHGYVMWIDPADLQMLRSVGYGAMWARIERRRDGSITRVYACGKLRRRSTRVHRTIVAARLGRPLRLEEDVDHRIHLGAAMVVDNRYENLRLVTRALNIANSRAYVGVSSGFKGVSWSEKDRIWRAYIRPSGSQIHLGSFPNEAEAARAYDEAAEDLWGFYALTNRKLGLLP
jgi:AP2 domain